MRISDWSSDVCSSDLREVVLRAGFVAFLIFAAVAWSSFFAAYSLGDASLDVRSLFGMTSGNLVPTSAAPFKESTVIQFTGTDLRHPGVDVQRLVCSGPYPPAPALVTEATATRAITIPKGSRDRTA